MGTGRDVLAGRPPTSVSWCTEALLQSGPGQFQLTNVVSDPILRWRTSARGQGRV